jgi:anti-anti-sigma factor
MKFLERFLGDAAILAVSGDLMAGSRYRQGVLGEHVERLARAGTHLIVLDLANLASADAMGIGEIAEASQRARRSGANLKLVSPRPRVNCLLALANLRSVIEVCDSMEQALAGHYRAEPRASTGSARASVCSARPELAEGRPEPFDSGHPEPGRRMTVAQDRLVEGGRWVQRLASTLGPW